MTLSDFGEVTQSPFFVQVKTIHVVIPKSFNTAAVAEQYIDVVASYIEEQIPGIRCIGATIKVDSADLDFTESK